MLAPCYLCQGTSIYKDESCVVCGGNGEVDLNVADYIAYTTSLNYRETNDLLDKLNAIIAEQASQREDLTTALQAIWNKVNEQ